MMLQVLRRYFRIPAQDRDIIHAFSGVRPIHDDNAENPSAVTRKYVLDIDDGTLRPRANKFAVLCVGRSSRANRLRLSAWGGDFFRPGCSICLPLTCLKQRPRPQIVASQIGY
jgi:hypothetical protein